MKVTLFLILTFFSLILYGQSKFGIIVDDDGYSNIREYPDLKSKVVSKLYVGEVFTYSDNNSSWFPVNTFSKKKGFVHKSRIQELFIDSLEICRKKYLDVIFLFHKHEKIISVCELPSSIDGNNVYSGIIVYDILNKKELFEFGEGGFQSFSFADGDLIIKEYSNIPINKKYDTSFVPYSVNKVVFSNGQMIIVKNAPFYRYPNLTTEELKSKLYELKNIKIKEKDFYRVINISLVLALNDFNNGKSFLFNLSDELGVRFDGEYGEKYNKTLEIYQINKNTR